MHENACEISKIFRGLHPRTPLAKEGRRREGGEGRGGEGKGGIEREGGRDGGRDGGREGGSIPFSTPRDEILASPLPLRGALVGVDAFSCECIKNGKTNAENVNTLLLGNWILSCK
jgi:hypothetical protein